MARRKCIGLAGWLDASHCQGKGSVRLEGFVTKFHQRWLGRAQTAERARNVGHLALIIMCGFAESPGRGQAAKLEVVAVTCENMGAMW